MVLSTAQLRKVYAPNCASIDRHMEVAYSGLDACFKAFAYAPRQKDTGSANCRKITGGTGWSLHAFFDNGKFVFWNGVTVTMALACDTNWQTNPYGPRLITDRPRAMIDAILRIRTNNGKQVWAWGGYYSGNKDAMHDEIVCAPEDLATGLDPATLPGGSVTPTPTVPNVPNEEDEEVTTVMWMAAPDGSKHAYAVSGVMGKYLSTHEAINLLKFLGAKEVTEVQQVWQDSIALLDGPAINCFGKRIEDWGNYLFPAIAAVGAKVGLPVDVTALAKAIGPLIKAGATKEEIAKAVVAEIAS